MRFAEAVLLWKNAVVSSPKVSIIIPTFNCADKIGPLLDHILGNPFQDFEVLVGDDGSQDGTPQKILDFSDPRIRFFPSPRNQGAGATRNRLIELARGTYIAIQDADDSFHPDRLVKQVSLLEHEQDVDVVGTGARLVGSAGEWGGVQPPEHPSKMDWWLQRSMVHASIMFRRSAIGSIRYHPNLRYAEDYYFLTALYRRHLRFKNIQEKLYVYNIERRRFMTRTWAFTTLLISTKWTISRLFPPFLAELFFAVNAGKMLAGYLVRKFSK